MKYRYSTASGVYDTRGRYVKRPIVEIEIIGEKKNRKAFGLIDSGADTTLMNIEYAADVGITLDKTKTQSVIGIGGKPIISYVTNVSVKLRDFPEPFVIPVSFIKSSTVDVLLGQEGFFDSIRIKFEKDHDTFELTLPKK